MALRKRIRYRTQVPIIFVSLFLLSRPIYILINSAVKDIKSQSNEICLKNAFIYYKLAIHFIKPFKSQEISLAFELIRPTKMSAVTYFKKGRTPTRVLIYIIILRGIIGLWNKFTAVMCNFSYLFFLHICEIVK